MLVEPAEDTKVLLCWNSDTILLSFRGTASMTNVLADLQVTLSPLSAPECHQRSICYAANVSSHARETNGPFKVCQSREVPCYV